MRVPPLSPITPRSPSPRSDRWRATRSRSRSPLVRDGAAAAAGAARQPAVAVESSAAAGAARLGQPAVGGGGAAAAAPLLRIRIRDGVVSFVDGGALREGASVVMEVEPNSIGETIRTIRADAEVGPIRWT